MAERMGRKSVSGEIGSELRFRRRWIDLIELEFVSPVGEIMLCIMADADDNGCHETSGWRALLLSHPDRSLRSGGITKITTLKKTPTTLV
jgi:hypothetical protein